MVSMAIVACSLGDARHQTGCFSSPSSTWKGQVQRSSNLVSEMVQILQASTDVPRYPLHSPRSLHARAANACKSHQPCCQPSVFFIPFPRFYHVARDGRINHRIQGHGSSRQTRDVIRSAGSLKCFYNGLECQQSR